MNTHVHTLNSRITVHNIMRDKADATEFVRSIDTSHHSNIRTVIPKPIYKFLKNPDKIKFIMVGKHVEILKEN